MTTTTTDTRPVVRSLTRLENRLLDEVPVSYSMRARNVAHWADREAVAAETPGQRAAEWTAATLDHPAVVIGWIDQHLGTLNIGVVRAAVRYMDRDGELHEYFEASPFPGGWSRVRRDEVLTVRSAETL